MDPLLDAPHSLLALTTQELAADALAASSKAAGFTQLRRERVSVALRHAMHVAGDIHTPLSAEMKGRLAERYINARLGVDAHTAGAVLLEAFSQQKLFILRGFPGTLPPAYDSISAVLRSKLPEDGCGYSFNDRGRRVHIILCTLIADTPSAQAARSWWHTVDTLRDTGKCDESNGGAQFNFASRRAMSSLHLDPADGVNSQVHGSKLWVLVLASEAKERGIEQVNADVMRDQPAGTHRFSAWLACDSFRWCILQEGDTIAHSRVWLHAVCCIGDEDSISSAKYCWLAGTPAPPASFLREKKSRKRKKPAVAAAAIAPPPAPLPFIPREKKATPQARYSIVQRIVMATLVAEGQPTAVAAAKAGVPPSAVRRWSKRLAEAGTAEDAPRGGRPRKTDAMEDAAIVRAAELHPFSANRVIRATLVLPISADTVQRRLDAAGLPSRIAAKKIHYTDAQRRKRLSFAEGYRGWTAEQWERVIFSDEVTIEGRGRNRQQRVHRPKGHRFDPQYTQHTHIYSPSTHIFACFCSRGPGFCETYEGKLDGKALRGLLQRTLIETADDYYQTDPTQPGHEQWWFQHDNSPPFKSTVVQHWLHNNAINVLDFPPHSPDLNPIENLWPRVGSLVDTLHPSTDEAVADAFIAKWPELSLDIFTDYAQSMPARIAAVIEAGGDATKY